MDAKTLEALRGSIAKWKAIEEGRGVDEGVLNCPLCQTFAGCDGCPVAIRTKQKGCKGSPYYKFVSWERRLAFASVGYPLDPRVHQKGVRLARAEREFLESLLPEGEQP